jgi:N-alpha-acetyltransferase 50
LEVYYNDIPVRSSFLRLVHFTFTTIKVGTICCRLENEDDKTKLYLMTMGVLAVSLGVLSKIVSSHHLHKPYRSRCLGSQSLDLILASATARGKPKIDKIYLHVQTSNDGAKRFYERHGFKEVEVHKNYYKKIVPHDAWVLEKGLS